MKFLEEVFNLSDEKRETDQNPTELPKRHSVINRKK